jgi:hypothetical protein
MIFFRFYICFDSTRRVEWAATTRTGPNDTRRVVWAIGLPLPHMRRDFFLYFYIQMRLHFEITYIQFLMSFMSYIFYLQFLKSYMSYNLP